MKPLVIYGAGGMGREVAETVQACIDYGEDWSLLGFLDDSAENHGTEILGLPVLGPGEWLADHPDVMAAMAIGHPRIRRIVRDGLAGLGAGWATIVHPSATVMPSAVVGEGCVIFAGCILSSEARLGEHSYMNYNSVLSHDASTGGNCCIMAQVALSGNVTVGPGAFVGVGVSTRQQARIGQWSITGAGSVVVDEVPEFCVAVGAPARSIKTYQSWEEMPPF